MSARLLRFNKQSEIDTLQATALAQVMDAYATAYYVQVSNGTDIGVIVTEDGEQYLTSKQVNDLTTLTTDWFPEGDFPDGKPATPIGINDFGKETTSGSGK